jgi:methylenetetrahydrofolate reductase (NADPH)
VLALRGDAIKNEPQFIPERDGHAHAVDMIRQIDGLNKGKYLHDEELEAAPTDLCVGAACYPEKHPEALNLNVDIAYLKQKVDAGAEYLVTQMFFDNTKFFHFVDLCREAGISVPIIPGLKPITTLRHTQFLPKTFRVDLPDELADRLMRCRTDAEVKKIGVEWTIGQARELKAKGVPCLHFYTMGRSEAVRTVLEQVF